MRVVMTRIYADPERSLQPGQEAVFPPEKAKALIASGAARAVEEAEVRTRPVTAPKDRGRAKQDPKKKDEQPAGDGGGQGDGQGDGKKPADPPA